jgi:hypothetical protein
MKVPQALPATCTPVARRFFGLHRFDCLAEFVQLIGFFCQKASGQNFPHV